MCLISIITINYNDKPGLVKTLESVIGQTFKDYELIVIDGGSRDGSVDTLLQYAGKITYWVSEADKGIYAAMNKGLKKANGTYRLFLNSADCLAGNTILQSVASMLTGEDIIYGNLLMEEGERSWVKRYPSTLKLSYLFEDSLPHSGGMFIHKNAFRNELSLYDESLKIVSDWKWSTIAIFRENYSYKHIDCVLGIFDRAGISSKAESLDLLNAEKKIVLRESFPLLFEDMESLIKYKNDYLVLMSSRFLKAWLWIKRISPFKTSFG